MTSPTQRSLKVMREAGFHCEIVEHFNSFTKQRKDLLGFADLLCLKPGEPPTLVQVTAAGSAARVKKILAEPRAKLALECGFRILVHGWRKLAAYKQDGSRAARDRWEPKVVLVELEDFDG
jgi:hypothetical protein